MTLPKQYLLSDLLRHNVICADGIDHGIGIMAWMHPPVHRLLGWVSKPSNLKLSRDVWRLDQLRGIGDHHLYVKGIGSSSDQATLDRLPTLLNSDVLNINGQKIGSVVDFIFEVTSGKILQYFISRSNPKIPGTSRWRLYLDHILDQQPGMISVDVKTLNDLPLARASLRQDFLRRSRTFRDQLQDFSDQASNRLEGWLDEPPWEEPMNENTRSPQKFDIDPLENWPDELENKEMNDNLDSSENIRYSQNSKSTKTAGNEEDPWI